MFLVHHVRKFYGKFERPISSLSLVGGFVFDALTLKRVDTLWENMWVLGHLVIVGFFMILIHASESTEGDESNPSRAHFWYVNIVQFFFGGTLSVYLVFYFRSADFFTAWPFLLILALAFWANESLKRHYVRLSFQISLFYLSLYSFAIFLVPVLVHKIGAMVFLLSGVVSLLFIYLFVRLLFYFAKDKISESTELIRNLIIGITVATNLLYFTNLIPPIPLSLKDGGVYHSITKMKDGNYFVLFEDHGWKDNFKIYKDFSLGSGEYVYAYSAIFSPRDLNTNIIHDWQWWNEVEHRWQEQSKITLPLVGGREGGYRTFSKLSYLVPGKWKVSIETEGGQVIGSLRFNIIPTTAQVPLMAGNK